jgi:hypothetical protein
MHERPGRVLLSEYWFSPFPTVAKGSVIRILRKATLALFFRTTAPFNCISGVQINRMWRIERVATDVVDVTGRSASS